MDEPLSNLDALLRLEMRAELKSLLQDSRTTTIYVTHDQVEAMSLADRIAVMWQGEIVQYDVPIKVYQEPETTFVGGFIGSPPMNFLDLRIERRNGALAARLGDARIAPPATRLAAAAARDSPEDLEVVPSGSGEGAFASQVLVVEPLGPHLQLTARVDGQTIRVTTPPDLDVRPGATLALRPNPARLRWFDRRQRPRAPLKAAAMDDLRERAVAILRRNDRGGYSVPTDGLYPFQWNWDSGFAAMGYGCFDEARAWRELARSWTASGRTAWSRTSCSTARIRATSPDPRCGASTASRGPPASPSRRSSRSAPGGCSSAPGIRAPPWRRCAALFPKLLAYHRWYHDARDPDRTGLVALYHPWETGMDNSPAWDGPLARVPVDPLPAYERRDTGHVDASQRPRPAEYDRYLTLVYRFRARAYEPRALYAETPFRIADVGVNSILHRADRDLLALAQDLGVGGRDELEGWIERGRVALQGLWSEVDGGYRSRDQLTGETLAVGTSASFLPLFAGAVPPERAPRLVATLERWAGQVRFLVPSTDPASPLFEPRRYWRGPVWLIVNWMIADGLAAYGRADLAERLRRDALELVATSGFWEYFDPVTGEGLGGAAFTWTAATTLFWLPGTLVTQTAAFDPGPAQS